jgi:hypothetical protein
VIPFRLLFWNMGRTATPVMVAMLAKEHKPDIITLVESTHRVAATVEALNIQTRFSYQIPFSVESRFQFFANMPHDHVRPVYDDPYLTIKHIQPVIGYGFLLAAVHLPSKLRLDVQDQASLCSRWARSISEVERRAGHFRTVVIGDLNMNPFEPGLVGAEGFHAVSSRVVAAKGTRTVLHEERSFFYNPMWSMMGDHSGTPGTFYYASGSPITYFWNTFDQVLLRPELARHFISGDVMVATSAGGESLLNSNGIPDTKISDHLPIIATLRLEDITNGS